MDLKVTGSRKNIMQSEYYDLMADLLNSQEIQTLKHYRHHITTTRFQHCLNVSYYHYRLCRLFRLDADSAAKAGLLHDLYFYDTKAYTSGKPAIKHSQYHPHTALKNAEKLTELNEKERDMIARHMWPVTPERPRYAETYLITLIDKYCAVLEFMLPQPKRFAAWLRHSIGKPAEQASMKNP